MSFFVHRISVLREHETFEMLIDVHVIVSSVSPVELVFFSVTAMILSWTNSNQHPWARMIA